LREREREEMHTVRWSELMRRPAIERGRQRERERESERGKQRRNRKNREGMHDSIKITGVSD